MNNFKEAEAKNCKSSIKIGEWNLKELFKKKLTIPNYQRPYSWEEEQVKQLIEDLLFAFKNKKNYLIGNLILYNNKNEKNENNKEVIDGQQRIITLSLIFKVLGENVKFLENSINPLSAKRLKKNYEIINNYFGGYDYDKKKKKFLEYLKEKVKITYMITDDLDEAFILFDSQNTRGKPLKRKDILKVHHIHPIKEDRKIYAIKWEEWEGKEKKEKDKLDELLYFLAFIRKAITNRLIANDLIEIDVYKEFLSKTKTYKLNNYNQPSIFQEFNFNFKDNLLELITKPINFNHKFIVNGNRYLPFEINSSIANGEMFFGYVWKYFDLYNELLENDIFNKLDDVYGAGNLYLKKVYKALLFYYVDKFEFNCLKEFADRILMILFNYRIKKVSVRADGVVKFIQKTKLFKKLTYAYSSEELIANLQDYINFNVGNFEDEELKGVKLNFVKMQIGELQNFKNKLLKDNKCLS